MAISSVDSGGSAIAAGAGDVAVTITGAAAGDVVHWFAGHDNFTIPTPTGFTLIGTGSLDRLFRKVLSGADASIAIPRNGSNNYEGVYSLWRGVDNTTPEDAAATTADSDNPPSITTATDGAAVAAYVWVYNGGAVTAGPSGYGNFFAQTNYNSSGFAWITKATAGAEDPGIFTHLGAAPRSITAALRPAAGGATIVGTPFSSPVIRGARRIGRVIAAAGIVIPTLHQVLHYGSKVI